jgi:hypothetical protein
MKRSFRMPRIRRTRAAVTVAGLTLALLPVVVTTTAPPAQANTTTNEVLVTNQYVDSTCAYNNHVLKADAVNPATGGWSDLGKPSNVGGVLVEAKPVERNTKVVALWGGTTSTYPTGASPGGIGVLDRSTGQWTGYPLPSTVSVPNPDGSSHSVAMMRGGYFAVAHNGPLTTASTWGHVVVIGPSGGAIVDSKPLDLAHGVEWDTRTEYLYAIGKSHVQKFELVPNGASVRLNLLGSYPLPSTGGHDIRRRRQDDNYFVTTDTNVYTFFPATGTFGPALNKTDGSPIGGGVKSIDQRFNDNLTEYSWWKANNYRFTNGTVVPATGFCMMSYKHGRWIWPVGEPVYADEATTQPPPPPPPPSSARPFVWELDVLNANQQPKSTGSPTIWAGVSGWNNPEGVKTEIETRIQAGKVPYVMFYNWGDNANPGIKHFDQVGQKAIDDWKTFAKRIAAGIGTSKAYVVIEPEWDINRSLTTGACSPKYMNALSDVITIFKTQAPNAVTVNATALWRESYGPEYECFRPAAGQFHMQGFMLHVVSNAGTCQDRTSNYGSPYPDGRPLSSAQDIVNRVAKKAQAIKDLYGGNEVLLYDLAVTSCWGGPDSVNKANQADIFDRLGDALPALYGSIGLRGALMRDGPPSWECGECAMGIGNERGFKHTDNPTAVLRIDEAQTLIQNHLNTIANTAGGPTFTSETSAPSTASPGDQVRVLSTVTNTAGSLSNATVRVDVLNASQTVVGTQSWTGQEFANGTSLDYAYTWTAGSAGTYTARVSVLGNGGSPTYHTGNAFTITVGGTRPAFTATASASPATVAGGGTTTVTVNVTNTGGALTNGVVDVEFYTSSGARVPGQRFFENQSLAAGSTTAYPVSWTAPAEADTYTVKVGVFGPGWNPNYSWIDPAGSVSVTAPSTSFSATATTSRSSVQPGGTATLTAVVTNTGSTALSGGVVDLEMYDGADTRVAVQSSTGQSIAPGASATYTWTWTAPAATGDYRLAVSVFTTGRAQLLHLTRRAATVGVTPFKIVSAAAASPTIVTPGGAMTITTTVTNNGGSLENVIVDAEVYDTATNLRVTGGQQSWSGQTLTSGDPKTYTWSWTAPATAGTYRVKVGVMAAGWSPTYHWNDSADTFTAANPAFTSAATVSASSVLPGGQATITATFTNTGGTLVNGITYVEVTSPPGGPGPVTQFWTGQTINTGTTATYTWTWTAPATPLGTYTVNLGVWSAAWGTQYHWKSGAATISVGGGTFQPSFTVGDGANTWWIELYTSNDVTAVDVIGRDGQFYLSLPKKSWGAWAATPPSELLAGQNVKFVARRSTDGSTAASSTFTWLTGTPVTEPGWASTFTVGTGSNTGYVELYLSASATAAEVRVGSGAWMAMTKQTYGAWTKATPAPAGSRVTVRAIRADGAKAYSPIYYWLQ